MPVQSELDLIHDDSKGRTQQAISAVHRGRKVNAVRTTLEDPRVVGVGEQAFHGRADQDRIRDQLTIEIRAVPAIPPHVVVAEPEGSLGEGDPLAVRLGRVVGVAELLEPNAQKPANSDEAWSRVGEGEERKLVIVSNETFRDRRDPLQVGPEVPGLDLRVTTEAAVPQALGQALTRIRHVVHTIAGVERPDELLNIAPDPALKAVDLN